MNAAFKCYVYRRYPGGGHQPIQARPGDPQGIAGVKVRRGDLGAIGGWSHFKEFITSQANLSAGNFADGLIRRISKWSGKHTDEALEDDLTPVVDDFKTS